MLRPRRITGWLVAALLTLPLTFSGIAAADPDPVCLDGSSSCTGTVTVSTTGGVASSRPADHEGSSQPVPCTEQYQVMDPQPPADYSWWHGLSPDLYVMLMSLCYKAAPGADGMWFNYVPVLKNQAPPPPDPRVVAEAALVTIDFPSPVARFGPDPERIAVNLPMWMSMADPGAITGTAAAGGVSVQLTGQVSSVIWSVNEPGAASVTCAGLGSLPGSGSDLAHPPCGFTFAERSLPERTAGLGKWTVTATAQWTVTWTSSTGATGTLASESTSNTDLYVGEYRTVMVPGG